MMLRSDVNTGFSTAVGGPALARDRGLAARLADRDQSALAELYDAYAARAFGLAYRVLQDPQAAEDVVHDAFLWAWEHADRIDETRGSPGALLLTVTHRRAIDALRRRHRSESRERALTVDPVDPIDHEAMEWLSRVEARVVAERMKAGLAELPAAQREAVEFAFFGGMTQAAIAEYQSVSVGTVKSRLRLAMARLATFLGGSHDVDM